MRASEYSGGTATRSALGRRVNVFHKEDVSLFLFPFCLLPSNGSIATRSALRRLVSAYRASSSLFPFAFSLLPCVKELHA